MSIQAQRVLADGGGAASGLLVVVLKNLAGAGGEEACEPRVVNRDIASRESSSAAAGVGSGVRGVWTTAYVCNQCSVWGWGGGLETLYMYATGW